MATLVERLRWWAAECDRTNFGCQAKEMLLDAADALEKAEPVKHGRWEDNGIPESVLSLCSECGIVYGSSNFNYCPNCGAKMDLEDE